MEALFFKNDEELPIESWGDIPEEFILGGGSFSKDSISEMFECVGLEAEELTKDLWKLTLESTVKFTSLSDESLKDFGVHWSNCNSLSSEEVNPMDLAGHLLEIKFNSNQLGNLKNIWVLFE